MSKWILSFPMLKEVRAAMADEDASEEQIEAVLLAFQEVTGMNVLDAEPTSAKNCEPK
jgi:hypothetical protein